MSVVGELALRGLLPRQRQQRVPHGRPSPAVQSDQHVFEYTVVLKNARALERPDQAKTGDLVRLEAVQQGAAIAYLAIRGLQESGEDIECGGLAGTVRADETDDFAVANRQIQIGNGDEPAEMHRDVLDRENDLLRCGAGRHYFPSPGLEPSAKITPVALRLDCVQFAIQRSTAGTIPWGRTKTIKIIKPP